MSANLHEPPATMDEHCPSHTLWQTLWAMLWQRCPRCHKGRMFRGMFAMNDPCPVCGLLYQREEGYFLGAMYVSYALGGVLVAIAFFTASAFWPEVHPLVLCLWLFAGYIPLMPVLFRYSRVIYMHLDYLVCSSETSATSYEKLRRHQGP